MFDICDDIAAEVKSELERVGCGAKREQMLMPST